MKFSLPSYIIVLQNTNGVYIFMYYESKGKILAKRIAIIVLAVLVAAEGGLCVFLKLKGGSASSGTDNASGQTPVQLNVDMSGFGNAIGSELMATVNEVVKGFKEDYVPDISINSIVEKLVFSDSIVNTVMSISYPLLHSVLTDLGFMDFAANVNLCPTPASLGEKLAGKGYSCVDTDGQRKLLTDVLAAYTGDWSVFDTKVTYTGSDGNAVTTTMWNSIVWGVNSRDSFFNIMADMSEGLRGVLQICLQGRTINVNVNVVDYLLKFDKININLDAAKVYCAEEKSGYENCIMKLFNTLGINTYVSAEEFASYENIADIWKAVLGPILGLVDIITADPVHSLTNLLVNFVSVIEDGSLCASMRTLHMDGEFHKLAESFMGFESGLLFNLGQSLIEIIESMGIKISGSFNDTLDSLLRMVLKNDTINMPDMDTAYVLTCGTAYSMNGFTVYQTDSDKLVAYLIDYILNDTTFKLILEQTSLNGTEMQTKILSALSKSREGIADIVKILYEEFGGEISLAGIR